MGGICPRAPLPSHPRRLRPRQPAPLPGGSAAGQLGGGRNFTSLFNTGDAPIRPRIFWRDREGSSGEGRRLAGKTLCTLEGAELRKNLRIPPPPALPTPFLLEIAVRVSDTPARGGQALLYGGGRGGSGHSWAPERPRAAPGAPPSPVQAVLPRRSRRGRRAEPGRIRQGGESRAGLGSRAASGRADRCPPPSRQRKLPLEWSFLRPRWHRDGAVREGSDRKV